MNVRFAGLLIWMSTGSPRGAYLTVLFCRGNQHWANDIGLPEGKIVNLVIDRIE